MDIGTISLVLVFGLIFLLAIGMPLGYASAFLALVVMVMKFEPNVLLDPATFGDGLLTGRPGTGPLYILTQKIFDLMTEYVLLSVPLFVLGLLVVRMVKRTPPGPAYNAYLAMAGVQLLLFAVVFTVAAAI